MEFGKKIPVKMTWPFFLVAALIGFLNSYSLYGTLFWIFVILISVLIHEYGHALSAHAFGQKPRIELVAFGGLTYPEGKRLKSWQEFIVVLAGPLCSLGLCLLGMIIFFIPAVRHTPYAIYPFLFAFVNGFWTILNLLPILPLDGGQLVRIICQALFGFKGFKIASVISIVFGTVCALFFFFVGQLFLGLIFLFILFQGVEIYKQVRRLGESDLNDEVKTELAKGELAMTANDLNKAEIIFEKVRLMAKDGFCFMRASELLAEIKSRRGEFQETFSLLEPISTELSLSARNLLVKAAFMQKEYIVVLQETARVFAEEPNQEAATLAAKSAAALQQVEDAINYFQAALKLGANKEELNRSDFDAIKDDPNFINFKNSK